MAGTYESSDDASLLPPFDPEGYQYVRPIASGGFGHVFLYMGVPDEKALFAVKFLRGTSEGRDELLREADRQRGRPNVVPVLKVIAHDLPDGQSPAAWWEIECDARCVQPASAG